MQVAFILKTPQGWFAHKILCDTESEAEKRVRSQYANLEDLKPVDPVAKDNENGHALYEKACMEARKRNQKEAEDMFGE